MSRASSVMPSGVPRRSRICSACRRELERPHPLIQPERLQRTVVPDLQDGQPCRDASERQQDDREQRDETPSASSPHGRLRRATTEPRDAQDDDVVGRHHVIPLRPRRDPARRRQPRGGRGEHVVLLRQLRHARLQGVDREGGLSEQRVDRHHAEHERDDDDGREHQERRVEPAARPPTRAGGSIILWARRGRPRGRREHIRFGRRRKRQRPTGRPERRDRAQVRRSARR